MNVLWRCVQSVWVLAPIFAWLPDTPPRLSSIWWWLIASFLVVSVGITQRVVRRASWIWAFLIFSSFFAYLVHTTDVYAASWIGQVFIIGSAAVLIVERGDWQVLRKGIVVACLVQVPFMIVQGFGLEVPFLRAGGDNWPISGTVSRRSVLSALLAVGCVCSGRVTSLVLATGSLFSGSWTGSIPAILKISFRYIKRLGVIGFVSVLTLFVASFNLWQAHFGLRWKVWSGMSWLSLKGIGFDELKGGFREAHPLSGVLYWTDYHNTFLDILARFGIMGMLVIVVFFSWLIKRRANLLWPIFLILWLCLWQSLEGSAVLSMLVVFMMMGIDQKTSEVSA